MRLILKKLCIAAIKLQNNAVYGKVLRSSLSTLIIHNLSLIGNIIKQMSLMQLYKDIGYICKKATSEIVSHGKPITSGEHILATPEPLLFNLPKISNKRTH